MLPQYAIITHNNRVSHVEVFTKDTISNMKEFFKGCINREMSSEEDDEFRNDWYLYLELDQDNVYSFELFHPSASY